MSAGQEQQFEACDRPGCDRKVPIGILYCCGGCSAAHDTNSEPADAADPEPVRRVFGHSAECDAKAAERGVWRDEYDQLVAQHRKRLTMGRAL